MSDTVHAILLALVVSIILWLVSGGPMLWFLIYVLWRPAL